MSKAYAFCILLLVSFCSQGQSTAAESCQWPQWLQFKQVYIQDGGRVVDGYDKRRITTSEGQSYGLFFALIANDQDTFSQLWRWTEKHLAQGDISARLPAWLWSPEQGVIDDNSASDSDLWIAYTLLEAGRVWQNAYYSNLGFLLAQRILTEEVYSVSKTHAHLLPGKQGFVAKTGAIKLNPSYVPLQLLSYMQHLYPASDWAKVRQGSEALLLATAETGYSPDWIWLHQGRFDFNPTAPGIGSYNAIRTYLWAGMLSPKDPFKPSLLDALKGFTQFIVARSFPPREVNLVTQATTGEGPAGFSAAAVPLLVSMSEPAHAKTQYQRSQTLLVTTQDNAYYDNVLSLFGQAWYEQRYRFNLQGEVELQWQQGCE
ncbi:cellulose synthase complex periplasmic endoglucanase BcsZ [Motilimonas pumila]|uniref:cellulase n=1 Tax=Motilimonas pumila TaxID=2303987 RepID=A0A418YFT2_9GAMM|nr:cellulose synthase complex periplasmic endoglucanase BcsZ [Motilimonas pumila]RJG48404.1 cellulase [Motilimonas pumila]